MDAAATDRGPALARLRIAHGQLGGLITMVAENRDPAEVLTLLAAITHALHRAGFQIVAEQMEHLNRSEARPGLTTERLEKLFLSLG